MINIASMAMKSTIHKCIKLTHGTPYIFLREGLLEVHFQKASVYFFGE